MPAASTAAVCKVVQYLQALAHMSANPTCVGETFIQDCSLLITAFGDDDQTPAEEYDIMRYHDYNSNIYVIRYTT